MEMDLSTNDRQSTESQMKREHPNLDDDHLYERTLKQLRDTAFLDLGVNLNEGRLVADYANLCENNIVHESYRTRYRLARSFYAKSWSGVCLFSSDGDLYSDLTEGDVQINIDAPVPTVALQYCPYIAATIRALNGDSPASRARIMRIAPGRSLLWHSHVQEHAQPEYVLTVQIPIVMPEKFRYCVVHANEFRWYKRLRSADSFRSLQEQQLQPGSAYVFNSYHYHNVYNNDDCVHRVTLMLYLDLRWRHVLYMVANALKKQQNSDWSKWSYK